MDIVNLWAETGDKRTDDINIIKSWLVGSTEGQTYSISDNLLNFNVTEIINKGYDYEFPEGAFDSIVGWKYDYKLDDPTLNDTARAIYEGLMNLNKDVVENPGLYFQKMEAKEVFYCRPMHGHIKCDFCDNKGVCNYCGDCPFKKQ